MDNVTLVILGQEFKASKTKLSEHSDYFNAMFNGNYVEKTQKQVKIDVLNPGAINLILQYIKIGLIDLSDHSLTVIEEITVAANFLQITELLKQIRYYLDTNLSSSNWARTMKIAESATFMELECLAAAHGLYSFKRVKPECIPTIHKLYWYLSHPYLDAANEFDVFKFGHEWIMLNESGGDALLLILCCLDYKRLTQSDLQRMVNFLGDNYTNSLAERVIECLNDHAVEGREFFLSYFTKHKLKICTKYTERVYKEVVNLIRSSIKRLLVYTPIVAMWIMVNKKSDVVPQYLFTYKAETGFEKWLEVADKDLWGWNVVSWGLTRVVIVCGEKGKGTGSFMKDVKVYDVLRKEWTHHGVDLPPRRHAGVTVLDDSLYLLGGVGAFRVTLDSALIYDLNRRTFRKIASLPDPIQSPATCIYEGEVYTSGQKNIYKYNSEKDCWLLVVETNMRASTMISFNGYLYCTQNYFCHFYRFKPGEEIPDEFEIVSEFARVPAEMCDLGNKLLVMTRTMCGHADISAVEEYVADMEDPPKVVWAHTNSEMKINDFSGSCVLALTMPPLAVEISRSHQRHLDRFPED